MKHIIIGVGPAGVVVAESILYLLKENINKQGNCLRKSNGCFKDSGLWKQRLTGSPSAIHGS